MAKAAVCKTVLHRFESDCRLHFKIKGLQVYHIPADLFIRINALGLFSKAPDAPPSIRVGMSSDGRKSTYGLKRDPDIPII